MQLTEKIEQELSELETIEKSITLTHKKLNNNIEKVEIIKKALSSLTDEEKKVIQRTCIDRVSPKNLQDEFKQSYKTIYLNKKKALNKLKTLMYGGAENES